mgnify:FL=1
MVIEWCWGQKMPYELFRTSYSHNSTQYSHIVKLTLHFYAHIGAGHQVIKLLLCKHIVIFDLWPCCNKKVSSKNLMFFKKTSVVSCYHFSSSAFRNTDLFGSVTLSAVTGGSCRSLASTVPILPGIRSVRRSEAIFSICPFHSSQPYGMFSVKLLW